MRRREGEKMEEGETRWKRERMKRRKEGREIMNRKRRRIRSSRWRRRRRKKREVGVRGEGG